MSDRPGAIQAARALPDAPPAAAAVCREGCLTCVFPPREVSVAVSETISNAPAASSAWNGTYGWDSKYTLSVNRASCTVTVTVKLQVIGTITEAQKAAWKSAIESKWNGKVKLVCPDTACPGACAAGYPVKIEVLYVTSGAHYTITANTPGASEGGRAGLGGTTSMTGWGVNDTVDITHEFGHMLGSPEEYFTTNGVDYSAGGTNAGFRTATGGVMNNPANGPRPPNYELIRKESTTLMGAGAACTTQPA